MAARTISTTDTLEDLRLQFNALSENDFGDIATLDASLSATSVIGAVNELSAAVTASSGFFLEDSSSTQQQIAPGQTLHVDGSTNINAVVSVSDTLTISLTDDISVSGTSHTFGTLQISGNTISSSDSDTITLNDNITVSGSVTAGSTTLNPTAANTNIVNSTGTVKFGSNINLNAGYNISFEGTTDDAFETTLTVTDPTADNTLTLPDETGTIVTTGSSGVVTGTMIDSDTVGESNMADDAIGQDQLKSVATLQIINSSGVVVKTIYGAGA